MTELIGKVICFFCVEREADRTFSAPAIRWPEPLPQDSKFLMCSECARNLSAAEIAARICEHVNVLRVTSNLRREARNRAERN